MYRKPGLIRAALFLLLVILVAPAWAQSRPGFEGLDPIAFGLFPIFPIFSEKRKLPRLKVEPQKDALTQMLRCNPLNRSARFLSFREQKPLPRLESMDFISAPEGGIGARDGKRTVAYQYQNIQTSMVDGSRMYQYRPHPLWSIKRSTNQFHMFCDKNLKPKRFKKGWQLMAYKFKGKNYDWAFQPKRGAKSPYFSLKVHGVRGPDAATVIELQAIKIIGPIGAKNWTEAFGTKSQVVQRTTR